VGVVAAHAPSLIEGPEPGLDHPGMLVTESDMVMDEIADCLDAWPSGRRLPKQGPGRL
jgi:hypothetical protein